MVRLSFAPALAMRLSGLAGWRRRLAAAGLGLMAGFAFAPLYFLPGLFIGMIGLLILLRNAASRRRAFLDGWWWGLGHFVFGSYWIAESFLVEASKFAWLAPPVLGALVAYLALYPALAAALVWGGHFGTGRRAEVMRILHFALFWVVAEWLRGHVLTGYPWDLIAYVWGFSTTMIQSAAVWGSWGLGFVTVLAATLPSLYFLPHPASSQGDADRASMADHGPQKARKWIVHLPALAAFLLLAVPGVAGWLRLQGADHGNVPGVFLRIVQPDIPQTEKVDPALRPAHIGQQLQLTLQTPGFDRVTHVIWSEAAVNYLLERQPELRAVLSAAAPPRGALITGAPRGAPVSGQLREIWNSLVALDSKGRIVGTADKFHLVPLGEYVPLRGLLPFIDKLTPGNMNFSKAIGPRTLSLPGLPPVGALICYEAIFPDAVVDPAHRPGWLVNLTNDGWFGRSVGPYQHFASARMRSVEEGLPLVRAANTGISAVIDAYGRVVASLPLGAHGVLDAALPVALPPTVYARFGPWILGIMFACTFFIPIFDVRKKA